VECIDERPTLIRTLRGVRVDGFDHIEYDDDGG